MFAAGKVLADHAFFFLDYSRGFNFAGDDKADFLRNLISPIFVNLIKIWEIREI